MRGKATLRSSSIMDCGITPAHAGKSSLFSLPNNRLGDHPRTCGEKVHMRTDRRTLLGSPPHMRGKEDTTRATRQQRGITPAHAGKRSSTRTSRPAGWDHPRTCGEKNASLLVLTPTRGSPPHMRGKVDPFKISKHGAGITPAHAGKRLRK